MSGGRSCDCCGRYLSEDNFTDPSQWSYTCPRCGFQYKHSSHLIASEQVAEFEKAIHVNRKTTWRATFEAVDGQPLVTLFDLGEEATKRDARAHASKVAETFGVRLVKVEKAEDEE